MGKNATKNDELLYLALENVRWHLETGLKEFGVSINSVLQAYFVATACIFEPERWLERLAWAKTVILIEALKFHIQDDEEASRVILEQFNNNITKQDSSNRKTEQLVRTLLITLDYLGLEAFQSHEQEISRYLNQIWQSWLFSLQSEGSNSKREAELIVQTINLMTGDWSEELQQNPKYQQLLKATNRVCHKLRNYRNNKARNDFSGVATKITSTTQEIQLEMQKLVQMVLQNSQDGIKSSFFLVAKSFYYVAFFDSQVIMSHIDKVLFQKKCLALANDLRFQLQRQLQQPIGRTTHTRRSFSGGCQSCAVVAVDDGNRSLFFDTDDEGASVSEGYNRVNQGSVDYEKMKEVATKRVATERGGIEI
ncbi:Gly-Xaa carboxypeptidase [Stylosanthes scabra]|uniref:Gly-Xaa carboxypeptidase n=1 Tax=Stylosanthes scabra TaxID=79078 RepID=A0ABU6ZHD6_9FABA|nr:Gly-Xaa carboxypeptidase [Stylosanthes scabra]